MIDCRYCNHVMIPREVFFVGRRYEIISCAYHKPTKVTYKHIKIGNLVGDRWMISSGDYRLSYFAPLDRTLLQVCHSNAEKASQYYELIRKFDGELPITPEQFPNKIKTLLAWS